MHGDTELKCVAYTCRFDAWLDTAPKGRIKQNHVHGCIEDIRRELLEVDDDRSGCQRHSYLLAHAAHPCHSKDGVFQVIVANIFDLLAEPDSCLGGPDPVWIEAEAVVFVR